MKRKTIYFLYVLFLIVIGIFGYHYFFSKKVPIETNRKIKAVKKCYTEAEHKVIGSSMEPLLKENQVVKGLEGYYDCNPVKRGDVVIIKFKGLERVFIKRIMGIPGDELEFENDNLRLNGKILKNSLAIPYLFSSRAQKLISISLEDKLIPAGSYLVLSDEPGPLAFDSRTYGFIQNDHLKGKVIY